MPESIATLPAIVRVLLVFIVVLYAMRKKLSLGSAFLLGSLLLGLLFGLGLAPMARSMVYSILYPKTLSLAVIVSLILVLSSSMERMGAMKRLLDRFQGLSSNSRLNLVVFPALIGLLPMPGGAVFSAPMVKQLGEKSGLAADQLSYVNYWFRHIWEYWWPLYPGILLATTLADLNIWAFVGLMGPLTLVAVGVGYLPVRNLATSDGNERGRVFSRLFLFLSELVPIGIVIFLGLGTGLVLAHFFPRWTVAREAGLILALLLAIGQVWLTSGAGRRDILEVLLDRHILTMIYMVFAILVFKGMMEDADAVSAITGELISFNIPLIFITVLLPFLVGGVVGITIAFVGSTFPILIPLVQSYGEGPWLMTYLMLALTSGFIGVLLSPLHLCLLLSNRYFGAAMGAVYRHLALPTLLLAMAVGGYFILIRWGGLGQVLHQG